MVSKMDKNDAALIHKIASRYNVINQRLGFQTVDEGLLSMKIEAANRDCPIDFEALLAADDGNFSHDVGGIRKYLDPMSLKLTNGFTPRHNKLGSVDKSKLTELGIG